MFVQLRLKLHGIKCLKFNFQEESKRTKERLEVWNDSEREWSKDIPHPSPRKVSGWPSFATKHFLTPLYTFDSVTLHWIVHYWRYIAFIERKNPSDQHRIFTHYFRSYQLRINILEFHVLRHLERLVLLSLWRRDFFHVDPGYWVPACDGISGSIAFAITDPESHAYTAFVDLFTDAFYLTNSVQIFPVAGSVHHIDDSINSCWSWALCAIKGEIPPSAAGMTIEETKIPVVKDSQPGFCRLLVENAFLLKLIRQQKQRWKWTPPVHHWTNQNGSLLSMKIAETEVVIEKVSLPSFGRFLFEKAFVWKLTRKEK